MEKKEAIKILKDFRNKSALFSVRTALDTVFPELKEDEDEMIRKELIAFVKSRLAGFPECDRFIDWLEKQGEQKPTIIIPKFKVGDIIRHKEQGFTCKIIAIDTEYRLSECSGTHLPFDSQDAYELVEQKPIDKIEPKFHEGDWVVFNNKHQSIYQVEKIEDGYYILRHTHGGTFRVCVLHDESLRPWTIQDAKDGDVLVDVYGNIGIFQKNDDFDWSSYCSLGSNGGFRCFAIEHELDRSHPATKEQRDALIKAMKEAGYEWDAEKKELKKIKQNNTDEYSETKGLFEIEAEAEELSEQKLAWSKDDKNRFTNLIYLVKHSNENYATKEAFVKFIKKLKIQYTLKLSDEQINVLDEVLTFAANHENPHWNNYIFGTLNSLVRQLKKLK